jgi:hypothetical protein
MKVDVSTFFITAMPSPPDQLSTIFTLAMTSCKYLAAWSNSDLVNLCMKTPHFAGSLHGNRLTRISDNLVVKFGIGVRLQEAANQAHARLHVDSTVLYVPQVFRYFEDTSLGFNMGFIVMEYVSGVGLHKLDVCRDPSIAERTMNAVRQLATIPTATHQGPGPVGGGAAYGYLWSENGTGCTLRNISDMETWLNTRLAIINQPPISLTRQRLTMRHMDLVRRNICILSDSRICFFDWAFAGFYPAIFEIQVFRDLCVQDDVWFDQLLYLSPKPDADEENVLQRLSLPAIINDKFW